MVETIKSVFDIYIISYFKMDNSKPMYNSKMGKETKRANGAIYFFDSVFVFGFGAKNEGFNPDHRAFFFGGSDRKGRDSIPIIAQIKIIGFGRPSHHFC